MSRMPQSERIRLIAAITTFLIGLLLVLTGVVTIGTPNDVFATIPMAYGFIFSLAIGVHRYRLRRKRRRAETPMEDS